MGNGLVVTKHPLPVWSLKTPPSLSAPGLAEADPLLFSFRQPRLGAFHLTSTTVWGVLAMLLSLASKINFEVKTIALLTVLRLFLLLRVLSFLISQLT